MTLITAYAKLFPVKYILQQILLVESMIPDIREGTAEEVARLALLTDKAYAIWQRKPRRV